MSKFTPTGESIRSLFDGKIRYTVPRFQREYSWKSDNIEQFWEDAEYVVNEKMKEYFIGPMVFIKQNDSSIQIVDGQQRLVTVTILMSVIRDFLNDINETEAANDIDHYVKKRKIGTIQYNRLTPSKRNEEFYEKLVIEKDSILNKIISPKKQTSSNMKMHNAYKIFAKKITNKLPKKNKSKFLIDFLETILDSFTIIPITAENDDDAFRIFETLNERGLELSILDLVKNYVLEKAGSKADNLYDKWERIIDNLDKADPDAFLRHHWLAHNGYVNKELLYKNIKASVKTPDKVSRFIDSVKRDSETYKALLQPEKSDWWDDGEIVENLKELSILGSKVCYPALLTAKYKLGKNEFRNLTKLCVNLFFRYKTIGDQHASPLEKTITNVANKLDKPKPISISAINRQFKKLDLGEKTFLINFKKAEVRNGPIAKYILKKINTEYIGGKKAEIKPVDDITLEHILPKTPDNDWRMFIKKEKMDTERFTHRIGNLTLLHHLDNRKGSNKFFDKKKEQIYKNSRITITKDLYHVQKWNEDSVEKRQEDFSKKAKKIWHL